MDRRIPLLPVAAAAALGLLLLSRARRYSFRGKVVLVTGGARGLGFVLAKKLAARGSKLVICARDEHSLAEAHRDLEERGAEVLAVPCDLRDRSSVERMLAAARGTFGRIDVVINNAGAIEVGPVETMTYDDYVSSMKTHFFGPLSTISGVLDEMRARRDGRIVNIASIGGLIPVPHLVPYSASKAALVGLSTALATELGRDGIVVTTICPGLMNTGSPRNARFKGQHRAEYAWFNLGDSQPLTAMNVDRAAERMLRAVERSERFVIIGLQARVAHFVAALFPNLFIRSAAAINRLLPGPGGIGAAAARGYESGSRVTPSVLTALGERAAERNHELDYRPR